MINMMMGQVSVDIRATEAGVLVEQFANVDDNVSDGQKTTRADLVILVVVQLLTSSLCGDSSPSP